MKSNYDLFCSTTPPGKKSSDNSVRFVLKAKFGEQQTAKTGFPTQQLQEVPFKCVCQFLYGLNGTTEAFTDFPFISRWIHSITNA